MNRPPRWPRRILALVLRSHPAAAAILGDLQEDFARVQHARGALAAQWWFWREALGLAFGHLIHGLPRAAGVRALALAAALVEDGVHAARMVRRSPGFCLFAAMVIGVGVGAVTTVFSVIEPLAFALPFEGARELVWIANVDRFGDNSLAAVSSRTVNLVDFRERARSFRGITGFDAFFASRAYTLTGVAEPERLVGVGVAHDFLQVLGVEPLHGRSFTAEEGRRDGPPAIILSHGFWRTRFAADPGVVGQALTLNGIPRTVVGILPPEFDFSSVFAPSADVQFLLPFVVARDNGFQGNELSLVGRLREGVTPTAAQAELSALLGQLQAENPERWGLEAQVTTLPAHLAGPFVDSLVLVAAAAATLLLIVCVNVSGLLLARGNARAGEIAVRKALGAERGRVIRQLVMESLAISLLGAGFGSALAALATTAVRSAAAIWVPLMDTVRVDASALAIAVAAAVLTGITVGTIPALQVAEGGAAGVLRAVSRGSSTTRRARRLQEGLVVAEVTFACALLVIGALLMASFRAVLAVDLGFEPAETLAWQLRPGSDFESHREEGDYYARLADRVNATAGVESTGLVDALPLGRNRAWPFSVVGVPEEQAPRQEAFVHVVDPGYVPTMRIPVLAGRNIAPADRWEGSRVVMLNESGARRIFGGTEEALGSRLKFWGPQEWEVVGVAGDVRHLSPEMGPGIEFYFPLAQMPDITTMDLVVRSSQPAPRVAAAVSEALRQIDPAMPTAEFWSPEATVRGATSDRRFALDILSAFGACALLLAGLGIYGVLARSVAERRSEIGIRMALGASASDIVSDVMRRTLLLTVGGIGAGWALSLVCSRLLGSVLFGVRPAEPAALLGTAVVLLAVALLAAAVPARRAVSIEAALALKS